MKVHEELYERVQKANKVLLIPSTPVDGDSLGSALAFHYYLQSINKKSELISWKNYSLIFKNDFPEGKLVKHIDFSTVNFSQFDLIIIFDGCTWDKALGPDWEEILKEIDINKIYLIDHHPKDIISKSIGNRAIVKDMISTSEVLYSEYFLKNKIKINNDIATYLYYAQVFDSQRFKFISPKSYDISKSLTSYEIDHNKIVDTRITEEEFRFTGWAIQHTLVFPFIQTMILPVYEKEIEFIYNMFGKNWLENDLDSFFKENFLRNVNGFCYGFTLFALEDGTTEVRWRTTSSGNTISIAELFSKIPQIHNYGGHRNAGGGTFKGTVSDALQAITSEMEKSILKLASESKSVST